MLQQMTARVRIQPPGDQGMTERIPAGPDEAATGTPGLWPALADSRFLRLLRHWAGARAGSPNPLMAPRAAIDPLAIRDCLAHVWIYQYLPAEDDFLCTLAGEQVNQAWGRSIIGRRTSELMPPAMGRVPALYRRMLTLPAIQTSRRHIVPPAGLEQGAERLIVPLCNPDGSPYGVFGLTLYQLGGAPRIADMATLQGQVTLYPCAELPAGLP